MSLFAILLSIPEIPMDGQKSTLMTFEGIEVAMMEPYEYRYFHFYGFTEPDSQT